MARLELFGENGSVLENLAPPPASIIAATNDRVFLAGVAGEPRRVWYSKLRVDGAVVSFHDTLTIEVAPEGGAITALGFLNGTLIVFKETAIYAIPGEGFDNTSGGQNYGPARRLSADVGAISAETVAVTPAGLIFKSSKGWYLLDSGGAPRYIGGPVAAFDADEVVAVHVIENQHQIRCLSTARMLVFDYLVQQWAEWTIAGGLDATIWDGTYTYLAAAAVNTEQDTYTGLTYGWDVETAWIKDELQGDQSVRWMMLLGEYRSPCTIRVRAARNYRESDASGVTWDDDKFITPTQTVVGGPLQLRHGPSRPKGQAIKFRFTAYEAGATTSADDPPTGEAARLTGLSLELGKKRGVFKGLPARPAE